ncbi:hypothetical protein COU76_01770 [Candidatus Peregrinibacteria bacterium CG10_big_fil_rev_8_21_14_0_10_49_10]|nr:MAG: hypothetical protein COU76_01770 [Candidatus Peregrinibacteria bacterium CG10_big_fil_rev_8_21_14_0_10_49_10]
MFLEGHTGSVVVTGAWWYVPREQKIFETTATVTPEFPVAKFSLSNNRGDWPVGDYRFTVDAAGEQLGEKVITVAREEK